MSECQKTLRPSLRKRERRKGVQPLAAPLSRNLIVLSEKRLLALLLLLLTDTDLVHVGLLLGPSRPVEAFRCACEINVYVRTLWQGGNDAGVIARLRVPDRVTLGVCNATHISFRLPHRPADHGALVRCCSFTRR